MCGGAIIYDYIPAHRRRVSTADFWPDANDHSDAHSTAPDKGKLRAPSPHNVPFGSRRPCAGSKTRCSGCSAAREAGADEPVPRHPAAAVGEVGGGDPRPRQGRPRLARHLPHRRGRRARLRPRRAPHQGRQGQGQLPQRDPRRRARARGPVHDGGRAPFPQERGGARGVLLRGGEGALRGADGVRELHELPRGPLHGGRGRGRPCRRGGAGRAMELRGQLLPRASGALIVPCSY
uniref:Uncharacterized protein n=1 Tax=Aegilops tauschii subsp. strangulata TaxID=200361 RepID=A0A453LDK2_AEGTS